VEKRSDSDCSPGPRESEKQKSIEECDDAGGKEEERVTEDEKKRVAVGAKGCTKLNRGSRRSRPSCKRTVRLYLYAGELLW